MTEKIVKKNDSLFPFQTYTFRNTTELETMCPSAFDMMLNPEHEHELWIGNINGLVSPTSEYGLAIKLKGYIIAGKKLTFILPENYIAIRPDNGNIGFRKTVLDMIRLGESRKQIIIRTYSIEHAEDDINKILKEFKETDMKFDVAIMNPPYDKNLHLKILEAVIPIADKVVNISPVRWLQDPLAKYKKNSDYNKFEESISKKIESLDVIDSNTASELFSTAFNMNLGIYTVGTSGYNYKNCENDIIDRILSIMPDNMSNHLQMSIPNNWSLVMSMMVGGSGGRLATCSSWNSEYDKYVYHNNKNNNGQTYEEYRKSKCWGNVKPRAEACHFEFATEDELRNFYNALQSKFFRYIFTVSLVDVHVHPEFYPYMQDYTQPWTDKRFCEYFGITGYIDDENAEPNSEWETILKTMEQYK